MYDWPDRMYNRRPYSSPMRSEPSPLFFAHFRRETISFLCYRFSGQGATGGSRIIYIKKKNESPWIKYSSKIFDWTFHTKVTHLTERSAAPTLIRIFFEFLMDTEPTSSIANPVCIMNTIAAPSSTHAVSTADATLSSVTTEVELIWFCFSHHSFIHTQRHTHKCRRFGFTAVSERQRVSYTKHSPTLVYYMHYSEHNKANSYS